MSQYAVSIPATRNHTAVTVRARIGRAANGVVGTVTKAVAKVVPLSPADRDVVEDLKAKKRQKAKVVINHQLPERAAEFRQVMGERVDITWGVGPQQIKMTTSGTVAEVTDTYVLLEDMIGGAPVRSFIPFGFIVTATAKLCHGWQQ